MSKLKALAQLVLQRNAEWNARGTARPKCPGTRPLGYRELFALLPEPSKLDVCALREVAEADPWRWSELTDLDVEIDRLERQGLAGSAAWAGALARLRWVLVGLLADYEAAREARLERRCS